MVNSKSEWMEHVDRMQVPLIDAMEDSGIPKRCFGAFLRYMAELSDTFCNDNEDEDEDDEAA